MCFIQIAVNPKHPLLKKIYQNPNSEVNYELPLSDQSFENTSAYSDNFSCATSETTSGELVSQTIIISPDVTVSSDTTMSPFTIAEPSHSLAGTVQSSVFIERIANTLPLTSTSPVMHGNSEFGLSNGYHDQQWKCSCD